MTEGGGRECRTGCGWIYRRGRQHCPRPAQHQQYIQPPMNSPMQRMCSTHMPASRILADIWYRVVARDAAASSVVDRWPTKDRLITLSR